MVAGSALFENTTLIGALMATPVTSSGGVVAATVNAVPGVGPGVGSPVGVGSVPPHAAMARSGNM